VVDAIAHIQLQLNFWTMGFIVSPFLSPFAFGFLVARTTWRWAYGIGAMYSAIVVLLIVFFMEETSVHICSRFALLTHTSFASRIYDRTVKPIPERSSSGLRYRIETLVGITGGRMAKFRIPWKVSILSPLDVLWRPHLMMILWYEVSIPF
jgi:MFS family permease